MDDALPKHMASVRWGNVRQCVPGNSATTRERMSRVRWAHNGVGGEWVPVPDTQNGAWKTTTHGLDRPPLGCVIRHSRDNADAACPRGISPPGACRPIHGDSRTRRPRRHTAPPRDADIVRTLIQYGAESETHAGAPPSTRPQTFSNCGAEHGPIATYHSPHARTQNRRCRFSSRTAQIQQRP